MDCRLVFCSFISYLRLHLALKTFFSRQDPYFKNPSDEEPFQNIIKYWMRDKVFAEQRLAGVNPMSLMRISTDRGRKEKF